MEDMLKHRILLIDAELMGKSSPSALLKQKNKNWRKWLQIVRKRKDGAAKVDKQVILYHKVLFIYLFIFSWVGSSFLCKGSLQLWQVGATLHCGAWAFHCRGLSCCGARAPDAQAQKLWLTGLVAPRHVGSSQTRARTRVPCIGRQTLNHCATREARP